MGRKRHGRELTVAMNGHEVGRLERHASGVMRFRYAEAWLARSPSVPVSLSLPLSPEPYTGDEVRSFFDNLLPDNDEIRGRMQRVLGAESRRLFDLLAGAGRDCVGALQFHDRSDADGLPDVRRIEAEPVSDAWIAARLRDYREHPLGMAPELDDFRISIAGAQEKTAYLWHEGGWHRPHGPTPTTHIFKLPMGPAASGIDLGDSVENEWFCLRVAAAFGLPVPDARIERFEDRRVLVVERFDRRWAEDGSWLIRLPQEDACQSLAVSYQLKYESDGGPGIADLIELLAQSQDPALDRRTFFKAQVVFWLLGAIDGHAKNFSLFLLGGGRCRMTPLYDILSAYPIVARGQLRTQDLRMAMAVDGKNRHYRWQEIAGRHWITTARRARFPESEAESVLAEVAAAVPRVLEEAAAAAAAVDIPADVLQPILAGLEAAARRI